MDEPDAFLAEVMPQLVHEETALHDGDAEPRIAVWSHGEPVTLFGAELTRQGWGEIEPGFHRHGDPLDAATREVLARRSAPEGG